MYIIIGGRGRLGRCLANTTGDPVHQVDSLIYADWWRKNSKKKILKYFKEKNITQGTVLIAAGVLDPTRSMLEHECANYLLPKHIIEGVNIPGFRIITFGTVMEQLMGETTHNPYIISKMHLSDFVQNCAVKNIPVLHVRLHTLYGGIEPPHAFMFLGQLLYAMNTKTEFRMTAGEQLREYHHLEDVTQAIFHLNQTNITGIIHLSHGKPEKLKDIANHVLNYFEQQSLLRLNALTPPTHENYDSILEPNLCLKNRVFRDTLTGIVNYLKPFMAKAAR
jgi:nucleoside-diphosphate-sugar epimerase